MGITLSAELWTIVHTIIPDSCVSVREAIAGAIVAPANSFAVPITFTPKQHALVLMALRLLYEEAL